jgi:acyl dehydratase
VTVNYLRTAIGLVPRPRPAVLPGRELTRSGVVIDIDELAAYARVCGFRLSDVLPATYPHVLAFGAAMDLMSAADFPFPVVGLVHVANRITVHRPVTVTEPLDLRVRATDLREHPRGRRFDVLATASVGGDEVWRGLSTYLRVERAGEKRDHREPEVTGSARWRVPARIGGDYAAVSGDRNPIHTSRLGARLFGFPRPIAHGMWSKARCLAALEGRLPGAYTVDVAFKQPIPLPSTVTFVAGRSGAGWEFALTSVRTHLVGHISRP